MQFGTVLSIRSAAINPTRFVGGAARRRAKVAARGPQNRCFLSYSTAAEAAAAMAALDGADLQGRSLRISLAQDQGVSYAMHDDGAGSELAAASAWQQHQDADDGSSLPTDFSSRSTKLDADRERQREAEHSAKSAMVCSICGKPGHFAQGCPLTLGATAAANAGCSEAEEAAKRTASQARALSVLRSEVLLAVEADRVPSIIGPGGTRRSTIPLPLFLFYCGSTHVAALDAASARAVTKRACAYAAETRRCDARANTGSVRRARPLP